MPRLLRYNLAPSLNGLIASLPHYDVPWIVDDPTIDFAALYAEFDTFLMGRRTYETFLAMGSDNPLAGRPRESVVVFSRSVPPSATEGGGDGKVRWWEQVTVVSGNAAEYVRRLKDGAGKDIWLMGGGGLARELLRAGLVDVVEAAIMPVIVGRGVGMFGEEECWKRIGSSEAAEERDGEEGEARDWKLVLESVEKKESGILMTKYRVVYE
ncbi:hypothetical protein VTJ49DRAFT_1740 [Mycothermus thermophilus]|uniref:2,5-diamino-6-ribosylamino-4(3H)-pyrimidinone 5'-phosphate reductase n=1 Tax=Humicola insolens TaxID=85995 RepID=A0ABR3VCJ1_HUMIN